MTSSTKSNAFERVVSLGDNVEDILTVLHSYTIIYCVVLAEH